MNDLRPQKTGWKQLNKMKKKELLDEIKRLDEVVQITARRFATTITTKDHEKRYDINEGIQRRPREI
jgi:hypothetical protein